MKLYRQIVQEKIEGLDESKIKDFDKLKKLGGSNIGELEPFINREKNIVWLCPIEGELLFHNSNDTFTEAGEEYSFGVSVNSAWSEYYVNLFARPISGYGNNIVLEEYSFGFDKTNDVIEFIKKCGNKNFIVKLKKSTMNKKVNYED